MLVQGKVHLIRHRDDMGCERLLECVRLRSGICLVSIFELEHAAGRGVCDCARMCLFLGQRECGMGMDRLRFIERVHLADRYGESEPTFVRFRDDGIGNGFTYWRLPQDEWKEWVRDGLPVERLTLTKPIPLLRTLSACGKAL